ncbi:MAG TPA: polysaccharide biosynthesis tyrosine autokinase [Chloroflexia bacterium]|nr:polysaccharide biosynthesis tyrosine autokinase [Chloroflexia bacterium]
MELLRYWKIIQKSLLLIIAIVALALGGTAIYTSNQPRQYESSSTLLLNPSVPNSLVPYMQNQVAANLADSYTELIRTRSFAESVVKELPFALSPDQVPLSISTRLTPNTLFYKITARMDDPEKAQQLVSTVVEVFLSANAAQEAAKSKQGTDDTTAETIKLLDNKLKYLRDQITSYETEITQLEAQPASVDRSDQLLQLRGQLLTLQQSETDAIVARAQLGNMSLAPNTALVIDQALPGRPVSSRMATNLIVALALSLLIGVGIAFLRDYLDYSVHSPEQLEETLGIAPMAAVGIVGAAGRRAYGRNSRQNGKEDGAEAGKLGGRKLVTLEHPRSIESESFRVLRTNIQFSGIERTIRNLAVTSAGPGEGKSFTSANLAIVMAQAGKRVILVDADLRKPSLHKLFEIPNTVGFTSLVINNSTDVEGAIQTLPGLDSLSVITSGPMPPNPSELLNSHPAANIMEQLSQQADIVIYDTPPAGVVTDPVILATRVDAVVMVVGAGIARRDTLKRILHNLRNVGAVTVLPVLNRVKEREMQGYYSSYYYYGSDSQEENKNGKGPGVRGQKSEIRSQKSEVRNQL